MRLNEMYPNLQTEKKIGPILSKILTKNRFVLLMTYISLNIEVAIERVIRNQHKILSKIEKKKWRQLTSKFQSKVTVVLSKLIG